MNRLNFALTIALTSSLAVIATLCCRPASCQLEESDYTKKQRAPLTAFKAKYARELNAIPRLRVIAGETKNNDASVLEASGRNALAFGNLDEAEVAFATSLSLQENGLSRLAYAMVLIEEKKYLEAIPSCAEVALVDRYQQTLNSNDRGVELRSAPHILLAYALAQIGEVKTAAIIYNYAIDRRMSEINLEIERNSRDLRQFALDRKMMLNLPEILKVFDPEKATAPQLVQALRLLWCVGGGDRLGVSMIKDAYASSPESALVAYLKGITTFAKSNETYKERLARNKAGLPFFHRAASLSDSKSELGMLIVKTQTNFVKNIKEMEDYIQENRPAFDNMP